MAKRLILVFLICSSALLLLAACSSDDRGTQGSTATTSGGASNVVHMDDTSFKQTSITLQKGQSITLKADTFTPHIIANGTWQGSSAKPAKEAGAPALDNFQVGGNEEKSIGPFTTAGTFQLYCTIHPGMNLTVTVQ